MLFNNPEVQRELLSVFHNYIIHSEIMIKRKAVAFGQASNLVGSSNNNESQQQQQSQNSNSSGMVMTFDFSMGSGGNPAANAKVSL